MNILLLGATGYVGMPTAQALKAAGHRVDGLARSPDAAAKLAACGVTPIAGDGRDLPALAGLVKPYDAVVVLVARMRHEQEHAMMQALIEAMRGSGRTLIFTSGTGVVGTEARDGRWDETSFAEDDPFPFPELEGRRSRFPTEQLVREAAGEGLRTMVVRAPLVWGHGASGHVPQFFRSVKVSGKALYLGAGLNVISNVHVDDLAEIYGLALEKGQAGGLYHTVGGEANFRAIAEAVAEAAGCKAQSMAFEPMCELMGAWWVELGLAINSRTRAVRSRAELGWIPTRLDLIEDIRSGSYREAWRRGEL